MAGTLIRRAVVRRMRARFFTRSLRGRRARLAAMRGYASAVAAVAACPPIRLGMPPRFDLVNVAMVYLLAVVGIALRFERGPVIATSVLSVAAFDFLFVPPQLAFTVHDAQYLLTFAMMLAVGLIVSGLTTSVRR